MSRYVTKPKFVDAWVIDPDDENPPEWVVEAFDKVLKTMQGCRPTHGSIFWNEARTSLSVWTWPRLTGVRGNILIRDGEGDLFVIAPEDFERDYERAGDA